MPKSRPCVEALEPIVLFDVEPLDPTFGTNGRVLTTFGTDSNYIARVIAQPSGKILVGGSMQGQSPPLLRFNADGTADTTFGVDGQATPFAAGTISLGEISDMCVDSQGRILATGIAFNGNIFQSAYVVERFLSNGTPDTSFGNQGTVFLPMPNSLSESIAVDSQDRIIVGGYANESWTIARFLPDGTPDPSFGAGNGIEAIQGLSGDVNAILPAPNGDVYAVGSTQDGSSNDMGAVRLLGSGKPDPTFGSNGTIVRISEQNGVDLATWGWTALLRPDGRLLIGGGNLLGSGLNDQAVIFSVMPDGSVDSSFGQDGAVTFEYDSALASDVRNMILRPDGSIIVVGVASTADASSPAMAAFNENGTPLASFGTNGQIAVSDFYFASAIVQDAQGGILVAGEDDPTGIQIEIARYIPFPIVELGTTEASTPDVSSPNARSMVRAAPVGPSFVLSRTGDLSKTATVRVLVTGVGTNGKSQGTDTAQITFPVGAVSVSLPVATYGPLVLNGAGNIKIGINDPGSLKLVGSASATLAFTSPSTGGAITGTVFNDIKMDGLLDAGDAVLPGITVYIDKTHAGKFETGDPSVVTDSGGNFRFTNLPAGIYRVARVLPAGFRATTNSPAYINVTIPSGGIVGSLFFGLTTRTFLSGTLFDDINGNGLKAAGDPGLSGWKVYIDSNDDGKWESNEPYVWTSSTGYWSFNLPAGQYRVHVVSPTGWKLTTLAAAAQLRKLSSGQTQTGVLLGEKKI